ncbi:MAG: Asp-tRNA(Asn)/Glu-tRNA(Gln) amidotransferase subunit GatB [Spirochaetaceae bacterium]|nr:Asp-tRNA(Asn)/Glu-tRNA(Gln) amidotransferase subunit GatB [Spirochaetaceae bacterium]
MYQSFIGLEVHIHLLTKTKVFCRCRSAFGDEPNTNVCPVCMGYPGVLPTLNLEAMRMGCIVARALNCTIPERTWFERKQYFYPDMTKNYQISQFASPLGQRGCLELEGSGTDGTPIKKKVRIKECHLEEDAGKMIHTGTVSLLDYNRAGVSLLEIVTEPDMETGEEAEFFIQQLRRMVRYLEVCDGNMEEGSLRADANVSINLPGQGLGKKVEIKNLNSSRFVRLGLNYEIRRQTELLNAGRTVVQETRLWNENRDETVPMRQKENAQDYRYFPEPDLPVFCPDPAFLASVDRGLVELPPARLKRLTAEYAITEEQAGLICDEKTAADYFEAAVKAAAAPAEKALAKKDAADRIAKWILSDIKHLLHKEGLSGLDSFALSPSRLASLVLMQAQGRLTGKLAKQTLELAAAEDKDPELIVREHHWEQITDPALIAETAREVLAQEKTTAGELQGPGAENEKRRKTLFAYLVGKVLAATGGRADPKIAGEQIQKLLKNPAPPP